LEPKYEYTIGLEKSPSRAISSMEAEW